MVAKKRSNKLIIFLWSMENKFRRSAQSARNSATDVPERTANGELIWSVCRRSHLKMPRKHLKSRRLNLPRVMKKRKQQNLIPVQLLTVPEQRLNLLKLNRKPN